MLSVARPRLSASPPGPSRLYVLGTSLDVNPLRWGMPCVGHAQIMAYEPTKKQALSLIGCVLILYTQVEATLHVHVCEYIMRCVGCLPCIANAYCTISSYAIYGYLPAYTWHRRANVVHAGGRRVAPVVHIRR